jgi:regulator of nonsense transcripts 2
MEVDFMVSDSLEVRLLAFSYCRRLKLVVQAIRPKLVMYKTLEEAAAAVDEMFNLALQNAGRMLELSSDQTTNF